MPGPVEVIDGHVHIIDRKRLQYSVVEFETSPELAQDWTLERWQEAWGELEAAGVAKVKACVFAEVAVKDEYQVEEMKFVHEHITKGSPVRASCAAVPLELGADATRTQLEKMKPSQHNVRSVRRLIQDREDGFACTENFIAGVRVLAEFGLMCEICIRAGARPKQCEDVLKLLEAVPECTFVLNHIGKPLVKLSGADDSFKQWSDWITKVASHQNVFCKISGVITEADADWTADHLKPFVVHAIRSFTPQRSLFGSDWFVMTLAGTVQLWFTALKMILDEEGFTEEDQRAIFHDTALKVYSIELKDV